MSDTPTPAAGRPRPWLLVALGITLVLAAWMWMRPVNPAIPASGPSNARRAGQQGDGATIDPAALDVRLEALESRQVTEQASKRNPFRFQPKPPPPPPPMPKVDPQPVPKIDEGPPQPPPPPPIPLKFIGIIEPKEGDKVAAFSDCRTTTYARPGGVVFGQYRLVSIGVESVVMEYLDGRGRTTIRQQGQECVGK